MRNISPTSRSPPRSIQSPTYFIESSSLGFYRCCTSTPRDLRLSGLVSVSVQMIMPDIRLIARPRRGCGPLSSWIMTALNLHFQVGVWLAGLGFRGVLEFCYWFPAVGMEPPFERPGICSSTWEKKVGKFTSPCSLLSPVLSPHLFRQLSLSRCSTSSYHNHLYFSVHFPPSLSEGPNDPS